MTEPIKIKFSSNNISDIYVENTFDNLHEIIKGLNCNNFSFVFPKNEEKGYTSIIANLLSDIELKEKEIEELKDDDTAIVVADNIVLDKLNKAATKANLIILPIDIMSMADYSLYSNLNINVVYNCTDILVSMSEKNFYNNFSYIMRLGIIKNLKLYMWLIDNLYEISDREIDTLNEMLVKIVMINKSIIENSEQEILTFGYEFSNAFYEVLNDEFTKGECLALGMIASSYISWKKDLIKMEYFYELRDMFVPFNLPISIQTNDLKKIENAFSYIRNDKTLISIKAIGRNTIVDDISSELISECIEFINFDMD
ncbi:MAG: hypothetical protein MJ123_05055 [Lachnospiraceae bacterium]|nr:hypothetical protein [Lachnospiraceae bacterium]